MTHDLTRAPLAALSRALRARTLSAAELCEEYLRAIETREGSLHAYLTQSADEARAEAAAVDRRLAAGEALSPLAGLPMALKDNLVTRGMRTTCASRLLADFIPPYDAHVVARLRAAGAVLLGKLNMDEFGMGSSTETSAMGATRHPLDPERVPGGSSGGSAAAVAAGTAAYTLGTDTGGSIRQPAAHCGVVGMKPTYGRVSRYGLVAFASSLDTVGPLTRTVADNAAVLSAIAGRDARDATSASRDAENFAADLGQGVRKLRIGLLRDCLDPELSDEIGGAVLAAARRLTALGATVQEVSLPSFALATPAYYILSSAEASSNLGRYDGVRFGRRAPDAESFEELVRRSRTEGFGREVKRRILLGTYALSAGFYEAYYGRAARVRATIAAELGELLSTYDLLLAPTTPTTAPRLGACAEDITATYRADRYTILANLAGLPALSLPYGRDASELPIGIQLMGRAFDERTVYRVAAALEEEGRV